MANLTRKVTFFIDDLAWFRRDFAENAKITPEQIESLLSGLNTFKAVYTLFGTGSTIDRYALTDEDGRKISLDELNGYQRGCILSDCMAFFEGRECRDGRSEPFGVIEIREAAEET